MMKKSTDNEQVEVYFGELEILSGKPIPNDMCTALDPHKTIDLIYLWLKESVDADGEDKIH